jgi:CO/xanthine dehydrogenase Mo-binding subunit
MSDLGAMLRRVDAAGKVTGEAPFPGDLALPGMLHAKVLWAGRPHARITALDTRAALAVPGVVAVFTDADVPVNEFGLSVYDQPVLCGEVVRFVGDKVALVVAESEPVAARGRDAVQVRYEDLPIVTDPHRARAPGAPTLHAAHPDNVLHHYRVRKGDAEAALAQAEVVVEGTYQTPFQEHAYLQPEAGLAYLDDEGRITVAVAGQWTHKDRQQIAHALDLPEERIRVVYPAIGGAFGGREDMSVQIILALAAWKLGRPVKMIWSREESMVGHHKRHPMTLRCRWGATRAGRLVAADCEIVADAGAYASTSPKVLGNATVMCTGPYEIPNVAVDAYAVYTNNLPSGAFRGFGGPQGLFAAEGQMNRLAEALGIDPVELRLRNVLREGSLHSLQTPMPPGVTIEPVVRACAEAAGWSPPPDGADTGWRPPAPGTALGEGASGEPAAAASADSARESGTHGPGTRARGIGFACGLKNIGFSFGYQENCWAKVEVHGRDAIESARVYHAGADVGQGAHTAMVQIAAHALGLPAERVTLIASDTASSGDSGSASASRMTFMAGHAIQGAAEAALARWADEDRPAVAEYTYLAPPTTYPDHDTGYSDPNISYGYVAQAALVEVDLETGEVEILDFISANDVGRAINPQLVEGQIEGGVVQAAGYALIENFVMREGRVLTPYLSNYLIPTVLDIPGRVRSLILEYPDPRGPWGARGMAEMPFLPVAAAICAAVHDATGAWFDDFPLTPERVLRGLKPLE